MFLDRVSLREYKSEQDLRKKPQQVRYLGKLCVEVRDSMESHPRSMPSIHGVLCLKADGQSGRLSIVPGQDPVLSHRTESNETVMTIPGLSRFMTQEALGAEMDLHCEMTAWILVPGKPLRELGFLWVKRAAKAFIQNGYENKGPLRFRLRLFGLEFVKQNKRKLTTRDSGMKALNALVVDGNTLVDVVPHETFVIRRNGRELAFFRKETEELVAGNHVEFQAYALAKAKATGSEGWVFKVNEDVFFDSMSQATPDSFGTFRDNTSVKIKEEFFFKGLLACKVDDGTDEPPVWLFEKAKPYGCLRYVGDVSDNARIRKMLDLKLAPITLGEDGSKEGLYRQDFAKIQAGCVQISVMSSGVTPNYFVSGVKQYELKETPVDYDELSTVQTVADKNTHFLAVKEAIQEMEALLRADPEDQPKHMPAIPVKKPRVRQPLQFRAEPRPVSPKMVAARAEPMPVYTGSPFLIPDWKFIQPSTKAVPTRARREASPVRQPSPKRPREISPVRQHSPEPDLSSLPSSPARDESPCPASLPYETYYESDN
jgi:hypothetical protein